jgi:FkbM family methyltransferase
MTFISYAQNFEDVMLWRALNNVENGFYIDIGAQDPVIDSISMAFYEHGWRGVHIEPTQQYSQKLRAARTDETVLQVAIGDGIDDLTFFEFENTGLSTGDTDIAQTHIDSGFSCVQTIVPVLSLDTLFEQIGNREIHWLKVDVEGLEKSVLDSWVDSESRPWVLAIESTKPLSQEQTYIKWESILIRKQYQFVYFDGLNRFYVSNEHAELASCFLSPPNIFDNFVLSGSASQPFYKLVESRVETKAEQAETKASEAETKAEQAETKAEQAETASINALTQLHAVYASTSWRMTTPIRKTSRAVSSLLQWPKNIKLALKSNIKSVLSHGNLYADRRPKLKYALLVGLNKFPHLKAKLVRLTGHSNTIAPASISVPRELEGLSPNARKIYHNLKVAIENTNKESH